MCKRVWLFIAAHTDIIVFTLGKNSPFMEGLNPCCGLRILVSVEHVVCVACGHVFGAKKGGQVVMCVISSSGNIYLLFFSF